MLLSQPSAQNRVLPRSTEELFLDLETCLLTALMTKDIQTLDRLIDDKLVALSMASLTYTKDQLLAEVREKAPYKQMEIVDLKVVQEGTVAIVLSDWKLDAFVHGFRLDGVFRVLKTWVQSEDGWRILSCQTSDPRKGEAWRATFATLDRPLIQN